MGISDWGVMGTAVLRVMGTTAWGVRGMLVGEL